MAYGFLYWPLTLGGRSAADNTVTINSKRSSSYQVLTYEKNKEHQVWAAFAKKRGLDTAVRSAAFHPACKLHRELCNSVEDNEEAERILTSNGPKKHSQRQQSRMRK